MTIKETAAQFFDACETGKGWETCKQYCHPQASFSAQADALAHRYDKRIAAHASNVLTSIVMPLDKLDYFDEPGTPGPRR